MLGDRVAQARKKAGISQRQLAVAMGERYDQTVISRVETGQSGLLGEGLCKAAEVLGVSIDYLYGLTDDPRPADVLARMAGPLLGDAADCVTIPKVAAQAGAIMHKYDDTVVDRLPFPRKWLEEQGLDPNKCHLMEVGGPLMEPTLPLGSTILIDLSRREFQSNRIYVMEINWEFEGKREVLGEPQSSLEARRVIWDQRAGGWHYFSDAGGFAPSPFRVPPEVIGEVRWVGRPL